MPLLAVPYRPSWVEHLILSNRNILADQMEFLVNHLPKNWRRCLSGWEAHFAVGYSAALLRPHHWHAAV